MYTPQSSADKNSENQKYQDKTKTVDLYVW